MNQHREGANVPREGRLYIIATPIGNLEDITVRAARLLEEADIIACEDTRVTGRLLEHLKIAKKRLFNIHARNEQGRSGELVRLLQEGRTVALVSDAGTPGISDPGSGAVRAAIEAGVVVESVPGPNAAVTALAASGLPTRSFLFEGFLPHKKGRRTRLKELARYRETVILYESPHRLLRTLRDLCEHFGPDRRAVIGRELTKLYEEYNRGTLAELLADYEVRSSIKGEIVLMIEGEEKSRPDRFADDEDNDKSDGKPDASR